MHRRAFNTLLCSWLGAAAVGVSTPAIAAPLQWFASAAQESDGSHSVVVFNEQGEERFRHRLLSRAHQVMKHPSRALLFVVDRRPGRFLDVLDSNTGALLTRVAPAAGQDFCGHIQCSADGRFLLTTQSITESSEGLVVFHEIDNHFKDAYQVSSGGLGPHQLMLTEDGKTLVVANGGIHERNRQKLNLEKMRPNLSYLDVDSGELLERVELAAEFFQASIRHIDVRHDKVLLAMQHQGAVTEEVPLVAVHLRGEPIQPLPIPQVEYFKLQQYCGSACLSEDGKTAAVSAPKGDKVLFWDLEQLRFLRALTVKDGCGVARANHLHAFIVSSGRGRLYQIDAYSGSRTKLSDKPQLKWDNHLALS